MEFLKEYKRLNKRIHNLVSVFVDTLHLKLLTADSCFIIARQYFHFFCIDIKYIREFMKIQYLIYIFNIEYFKTIYHKKYVKKKTKICEIIIYQ